MYHQPKTFPSSQRSRAAAFSLALLGSILSGLAQAPTNATPPKVHVLLITGIDYPGHVWKQTAPVLANALREDPRLEVCTVEDPHFLDSQAVQRYEAIVLHFQNWQQPGPNERARENLRQFVLNGKGVVLVHFACGAWYGEWPEFANLAGRAWFGPTPPAGQRQHDPYGQIHVEFPSKDHVVVRGLPEFDTQDELYTCLVGAHPIEVIAQAKSKVDGKNYPMAFLSSYGQGRTFHCTLGHDAKALSTPGVQELYRRGCAWAAGLTPVP